MRKFGRSLTALLLLLTVLSFGLQVEAMAEDFCTVTYYTDANMNTVYETQTVPYKGYATPPKTDPPSYTIGGFRYVFDKWYRSLDGNVASAFSFTESKIRRDIELFAGYAQYLAEGYTLVVYYDGGSAFVNNTTKPISEILAEYPEITSTSVVQLVQGGDVVETTESPTSPDIQEDTPTTDTPETTPATETPEATPATTETPEAAPATEPVPAPSESATEPAASSVPGDADGTAETPDTQETSAPGESDTEASHKVPRTALLVILVVVLAAAVCCLWFIGRSKRK